MGMDLTVQSREQCLVLGFEDSYDSQFYYLYDTSYPWNGPLFGIQYALNDIPCCPNTTCNDENSGRPRPVASLTTTTPTSIKLGKIQGDY